MFLQKLKWTPSPMKKISRKCLSFIFHLKQPTKLTPTPVIWRSCWVSNHIQVPFGRNQLYVSCFPRCKVGKNWFALSWVWLFHYFSNVIYIGSGPIVIRYLWNVVYFDQLLGAARTQKLVETFFSHFSTFFVHFKAYFQK